MPGKRLNFDAVRKIALALPGAEESTGYGVPAFKVGGKMFACVPSHRSAEPDSLAIRIDFDQREALLAEAPEAYYLTPHYVDYPIVLARLASVDADALRDLLGGAIRYVSAENAKRKRAPRKQPDARSLRGGRT